MVNIKQSETTNMLSFLVMVPPYLLVIVKLNGMNIPSAFSNEYIYYYNILYESSQIFNGIAPLHYFGTRIKYA
jgi:hypothetical protein